MKTLIEKIRQTIAGTEFEGKTFIVGGFVRDTILGRPSKDLDFCVELPEGGIKLAKFLSEKLNGTNVVIFERFGTAQVVIDGLPLEFVHTRKEIYTEGSRKPDTTFGTIEEDAFRRDFTINALMLNVSTGSAIDPTNMGVLDIVWKKICTTGDPVSIFHEDPLRMLRAIRFATQLGFVIDDMTLTALKFKAHSIKTISKERVRDEFVKILTSNDPVRGINLLIETGLIDFIFPQIRLTIGMTQNMFHTKDVFGHICDVIEFSKPTPLHRMAALLHDIGKITTRTEDDKGVHFFGHDDKSVPHVIFLMETLKFSGKDIDLVSSAVANHMLINRGAAVRTLRKKRMELGEEKWNFLLDLCEADRKSHANPDLSGIEEARNLTESEVPLKKDKLPVNGEDIMTLFDIKPGIEVGKKMMMVQDWVLEDPSLTRTQIIDRLTTGI